MNSRERFFKVINGEIPDRVPITLFIRFQGFFISQIYPDIDPCDYDTFHMKIIEFQKQLGIDVFVRMSFDLYPSLNINMGGLDVSQQTENWEVETKEIQKGNTLVKRSTIRTPDGNLTQDFSINEIRPGTYMFACTKKPIESPKDLEMAVKYEPGMPNNFKANVKKKVKRIKDAVGNDGIVGVWVPGGPFNNISTLINQTVLYSVFLYDYGYYKELMEFALKRMSNYTEAVILSGVDVACVGGNVAGGFVGKNSYEKYILPFEKRYIDDIQKNGIPAIYHNCGQIMDLIESYKKLGCKIVEPFSPPPILGDADLAEAVKIVDGNYIIIGGVDQVKVLKEGSIEQVKKVTEKTIKIGKPNGKFILQNADFLEYGTPIKNLKAFVETGIKNAWY